jgi:hypothetical protein
MINIKASATKINGYMKKSSKWVIDVGKELSTVQSLASEKEYLSLYDMLPFGEKVGEKFIAIAADKFIEKYVDIVPAAYNTLYDMLLSSKIKDKTKLDPELVWNEIGNEMMFGAPDYDFSISGMALNPASTKEDIEGIFKLLKMASKHPDLTNGGVAGATGELSGFALREKEFKKEAKAKKAEEAKAKKLKKAAQEVLLKVQQEKVDSVNLEPDPDLCDVQLDMSVSVADVIQEKYVAKSKMIVVVNVPGDFNASNENVIAMYDFQKKVKALFNKTFDLDEKYLVLGALPTLPVNDNAKTANTQVSDIVKTVEADKEEELTLSKAA